MLYSAGNASTIHNKLFLPATIRSEQECVDAPFLKPLIQTASSLFPTPPHRHIADSVTIYHGSEPGLHQSPYTLYVYTVQAIQVVQTGSP